MDKTQKETPKTEEKNSKHVLEILKDTNLSLLFNQDTEPFEENGKDKVTYKKIEDMF